MTILLFYVIPFAIITITALVWAFKNPGRTSTYRATGDIDTKRQIDELYKQQTYKFWRDFDK